MADILTSARRSENMRHIKSKGTKPEMILRKFLHNHGYRYRLHVPGLPGKPDLVFPKLRKVIFVHGCFWHLHSRCREGRVPGSRRDYWEPKLRRNVQRDREHLTELRNLGWKTLVIWECEIKKIASLESRLMRFLS